MGQCLKCGNKYHPGHICPDKTLNALQASEEVVEVYDEDCWRELRMEQKHESDEECKLQEEEEMQEQGVSIHALNGERQQDTIKTQWEAAGKTLMIVKNGTAKNRSRK